MGPHLEAFDRIKEWTDLGNWLQKTAKLLETYPTKYIPHKKMLAKRLSQCLNDSLPIGIHRTALSIYMIIFEQIKQDKDILCADIAIYSFGLFPFFPKSSIQVKPDMLEIFRKYYLALDIQIIPMLTGFISCLLPGLDEQDETLQKQIFELLNDINLIVGDKFFLSSVWFVLLKNSKNRLACFKILNKKFGESISSKSVLADHTYHLSDGEKSNPLLLKVLSDIKDSNGKPSRFFPNSWTVTNGLGKCLEDDDVVVKKNCLDFMYKHVE